MNVYTKQRKGTLKVQKLYKKKIVQKITKLNQINQYN